MTIERKQQLFRQIEINHDVFIHECHWAFICDETETETFALVYGPYDYEN